MKPSTRADVLAVDDARERIADGLKRGDWWFRRNPFGKCNKPRYQPELGFGRGAKSKRCKGAK